MFITNYKGFKEIFTSKVLSLEMKIHIFEADISELVYRFWCRITGGRFERRHKKKQNACTLVTKRGFHLISTFLVMRKKKSISASELEVYERNCSGSRWGTPGTMYCYRWSASDVPKCRDCGRPYEVLEDDRKIVGKF